LIQLYHSTLDARALFERVIPMFALERACPLWERWAQYEYQYGDLKAAQKLEKWVAEVYPTGVSSQVFFCHSSITDTVSPSDPPIERFAQHHIYLGMDAIAARDLGFAMARQGAAGNGIGRTETQQSLMGSNFVAHPYVAQEASVARLQET